MTFKTFKGIKAAEYTQEPRPEPEPPCEDPSELDDPVEVKWYCGLAVGPPYWQGTEIYESDECSAEGVMYVEREDFEEGSFGLTCPVCGQELEEPDHFDPPRLT
jgi:hypothetical protein